MGFVFFESLRSALVSVRAHGFRSFLTTLGIIIGVTGVIAVVSLTDGLRTAVGEQFSALGTNSLTIRSQTPIEDQKKGLRARLTADDLQVVERRVEGIASITPVINATRSAQVRYGAQTAFSQIMGTTHAFQYVAQLYVARGRFLADSDNDTRRRVVVVGETLRENLGLPEDPVNAFVELGGEWFRVIGLLQPKGEILGFNQDDVALVPFATLQSIQGNQMETDISIQLSVTDGVDIEATAMQITSLLRSSRGLTPGAEDDFAIQTPEQLMDTVDTVINMVTVVIGGIVAISLLVGGIGIMNIMLVSVTERTREIGICKAIGAQRHHILLQFLLEALLLSLLGGALGLALGYGLGALIANAIPNFPAATIPLWAAALALGFSGFVGVVFGILPAAKAANLDPIDALRYE